MRVRARRRLIGMLVLVGAGVLGFPWLFETQPRPMAGDIQIVQAPQSGAGAGAGQGATGQGGAPASAAGAITGTSIAAVTAPTLPPQGGRSAAPDASAEPPAARVGTSARADEVSTEREEIITEAPSRPGVAAPTVSTASASAASRSTPPKAVQAKPVAQAASKVNPGRTNEKPVTRYVVQFGAFADVKSAHEARMKAERLGLKTYAQQVDTPQGKRIRVRLGPFTDKAEADKAAATLRKAALPGAVLTL